MVLFCHITTRIPGRAHDGLLREKGGRGFPTLYVMDAAGEVIAQPQGRDVATFEKTLARAKHYLELSRKTGRSLDEEVELLLLEVELGKLAGYAAARARVDALKGLSEAQQQKLDAALVDLEVMDAVEQARPRTLEQRAALGKRFAAMQAAGKAPTQQTPLLIFHQSILDHAEQSGDAALFESSLEALRARFGGQPGAERFFQQQEQRLKQLRAGQKG